MSSFDLEALAAHREQILLAEVAGWLHDMGKCSDEMVNEQASDKRNSSPAFKYKTHFSSHIDPSCAIGPVAGETEQLKTLVERGAPKTWLMRALGRCHNAAHIDKQEPDEDPTHPKHEAERFPGKQPRAGTRLSSAFGVESAPLNGLTARLTALPLNPLAGRATLRAEVRAAFSGAPGDTRRPENEVTLWDWSSIVAALFKAAVAGAVLGHRPAPVDLRWRLLTVRADRAAFTSKSVKLSDVVAREQVLDDAFDRVRLLLEETYPLGTLFYRDADNAVFIVPDLADLLDDANTNGQTLRNLIKTAFVVATRGEVSPELSLEDKGWWAQSPNYNSRTNPNPSDSEMPELGKSLGLEVSSEADINTIASAWQNITAEPCPVCRLRPTAPNAETCDVCAERRGSRTQRWREHPSTTIWMDELADDNGRVAMLVGKFGLDDWLSGDMIRTLLVKDPGDNATYVPKNASPARLRRVWETCQAFWQTAQKSLLPQTVCTQARWMLSVDDLQQLPKGRLLDGSLDGKPISVWHEGDTLITISRFQRKDMKRGRLSLMWDKQRPELDVTDARPAQGDFATYTPLLPLLQSPDQFMALLPADKALDAAQAIFNQYVLEFAKVRNRLPLFLGVVFFPRKTPLSAVMDSARRMLAQATFDKQEWKIVTRTDEGALTFDNGITWSVPLKMGDGKTDDVWYPYFNTTHNPGSCTRRFVDARGAHWVHAGDLHSDDTVSITPSHFAYTFLESASDRFRLDPKRDAMLLDELPRLLALWQTLKGCAKLTDTELRNVHSLLADKRAAWGATSTEFRKLVTDTLQLGSLQGVVTPDDVLNGRFDRCLDLHLRILKARIGRNHTTTTQEQAA